MIIIGLGANLDGVYGTPLQCLQKCASLLADKDIFITKSSNIWKSAPVPISDQPWYHNAVCIIETILSPLDTLKSLAEIEEEGGRTRSNQNAPRTLDLDLLCYDDEIIDTKILQIPHPRMHLRAFTLYPLQEVAPNWVHPSLGNSVDTMIASMPKGQKIKRIDNSTIQSTARDKTEDNPAKKTV